MSNKNDKPEGFSKLAWSAKTGSDDYTGKEKGNMKWSFSGNDQSGKKPSSSFSGSNTQSRGGNQR